MSTEKPGYFAILPANVRYDEALRPNAKLLFAEITALSNAQGFCVAGNAYFSDLFGLTKKTVSELIAQLEKRGYIQVEVLRSAQNEVVGREIYITDPIPKNRDTSPEKTGDCIPKKTDTPIPKNVKDNNNILINNNRDVWVEYAGADDELLTALRDFETMRVKRKKPMTDRSRTVLAGKLDQLSGGDSKAKVALLEQSIVHCWDSVYPLKSSEPAPERPQGRPQSRRYEEW